MWYRSAFGDGGGGTKLSYICNTSRYVVWSEV